MFSRWPKTFVFAVVAYTLTISTVTAYAELVVRSDLRRVFDDAGVSGTFALTDITADRTYVADPARVARRTHPALMLRTPNSLIAFDTGVVCDGQKVLPHGGKPQPYKQWEHDMVLPEAIRLPAVPIYQEVACRVGFERTQAYVDASDYGDRQLGGVIDQPWLRGPLKISAFEEARFISRMVLEQSPVKPRTWDMVQRILLTEQQGDAVLYAKTGVVIEYQPEIGWWVDWVKRAGHVYAFALNTDMPREGDMAKRIPLDKQLTRAPEVWSAP